MSEQANHPDFDGASEHRRWTKPLAELGRYLREQAWKLRGEWAWVVLPRGALVAMSVGSDFQKRLRIARREPPKDEAALKKWSQEIEVFRKHLGCEVWALESHQESADMAEVIYIEKFAETEKPKCAGCGEPVEAGPYKEPLCTRCAMTRGNEEIAERQSAHTSRRVHP